MSGMMNFDCPQCDPDASGVLVLCLQCQVENEYFESCNRELVKKAVLKAQPGYALHAPRCSESGLLLELCNESCCSYPAPKTYVPSPTPLELLRREALASATPVCQLDCQAEGCHAGPGVCPNRGGF